MIQLGRSTRGRTARWGALLAVAGTVVLAVVFSNRFGTDPTQVDSPLIGQPVPELILERLDGSGSVSLRQLRGEILVVNFFASWCLACRYEHDDLMTTQVTYRDRGVRVLGIVYQDDPAQATAFLNELGYAYEALLDPDSRAAIEFGVFGVPETFFIDRDGVIAAKIFGESDFGLVQQIIEAILAGERPESAATGTVQPAPGS